MPTTISAAADARRQSQRERGSDPFPLKGVKGGLTPSRSKGSDPFRPKGVRPRYVSQQLRLAALKIQQSPKGCCRGGLTPSRSKGSDPFPLKGVRPRYVSSCRAGDHVRVRGCRRRSLRSPTEFLAYGSKPRGENVS